MVYRRSPLMQERLADNRQRILSAARRLIRHGGLREASITAVAREAGLSTGALYRYFPSKAELFVEVLTLAVANECALLRAIIERPGTATERLRAAVESFAQRALEGPHLAYAFIAEPADAQLDAARIACREQFGEVFKSVLREGIAAGEFPAQSVDVSAACIVGAFTEALIRPVAPPADHSPDRQGDHRVAGAALVDAIAGFCVAAVLGAPRAAGG